MNEQINLKSQTFKQFKAYLFPNNSRFRLSRHCNLCRSAMGYKTFENKLYKDNNCLCLSKLQKLEEVEWITLLPAVPQYLQSLMRVHIQEKRKYMSAVQKYQTKNTKPERETA